MRQTSNKNLVALDPKRDSKMIEISIYIGIKSSTVQKTSSTERFLLSPSSEFMQVKKIKVSIFVHIKHMNQEKTKKSWTLYQNRHKLLV